MDTLTLEIGFANTKHYTRILIIEIFCILFFFVTSVSFLFLFFKYFSLVAELSMHRVHTPYSIHITHIAQIQSLLPYSTYFIAPHTADRREIILICMNGGKNFCCSLRTRRSHVYLHIALHALCGIRYIYCIFVSFASFETWKKQKKKEKMNSA